MKRSLVIFCFLIVVIALISCERSTFLEPKAPQAQPVPASKPKYPRSTTFPVIAERWEAEYYEISAEIERRRNDWVGVRPASYSFKCHQPGGGMQGVGIVGVVVREGRTESVVKEFSNPPMVNTDICEQLGSIDAIFDHLKEALDNGYLVRFETDPSAKFIGFFVYWDNTHIHGGRGGFISDFKSLP